MSNEIGQPTQRGSGELNLFIGETVVISKGKHHPPNLTVAQINKEYRVIQSYPDHFPSKLMIKNCGRGIDDKYIVVDVNKDEFDIINKAIRSYKKNQTGAVQAYSYLLGYCEARGLNLIEECILEN